MDSTGSSQEPGAIGRLARRVTSWFDGIRRAVPALDLGRELVVRFRDRDGTVLAGHLTYRLFVFTAPLMLVVAAVLGYMATENLDIIRYATEAGVPADTARDVTDQTASSRLTALAVGLPALAIAGAGLVRGLQHTYAAAWGVPNVRRPGAVRRVGVTLLTSFGVMVLYAVAAVVERQGPAFAFLGWAGTMAITAATLWAVCWGMPRRTTRALDLVPGAVAGAVGVSVVQVFLAVYLPARVAGASAVYGAIGTALALLFFLFLVAYVFLVVALVNSVWFDRYAVLAGRPWILDPESLPTWLRRPARRLAAQEGNEGGAGEPGFSNGRPGATNACGPCAHPAPHATSGRRAPRRPRM